MPCCEVITPPNVLGMPSTNGWRAGVVVIVALRSHTHNGVGGSTIRNQTTSRHFPRKMVYLLIGIREGLRVIWCREPRGNSRVTLAPPNERPIRERYGWNRAGWESTDRLHRANLRNSPARNRPTSPARNSAPHVRYAKNCS